MDTNFETGIQPFFWVEHENSVSVCLEVGEYKADIFQAREDEGFEGNGYDWASLAQVFIDEKMPEQTDKIEFDPESDMFCAFSSNAEALKAFIISFKEACENDELIKDLFSRAESELD